jgi:hypothetical protein
MITKKDSGINFSILSQYLYALTAINKLETEEVDAFKKLDNQELRDKSDKYIVEQRETLLRQLKNLEPKISVFADQVTEMKETQYKTVFELPKKTAENVSVESATLKKYVEKFNKIKTLPDEDLRLAEIEKFILNHGLFNRVLRNGMLERVPINEAKYVYWDIPNVKEKMICKHWLLLTKQAWKSNEERKQLQDLLESQWGSRVPNSRYIYCTNCAQIIGLERESDMEGFDDENNAIKLREAVYDPSDLNDNDLLLSGADRDLSKMFVGRDQELYDLLLALISEPLIDMDYNTKLEVVQQTSVKLGEIDSGFFLFESNLVITGINTLPKLAGFVSSGLSKYRTMRAELFPGVAILSEDELARSEADPKKKQFLVVLNKIRSEYDSMISFKTLAIMAGRIVYALVASRPEIKIYGGAERFGQLSIVNNYLINIDKTIDMISKIVEKVVFAGTTGIYKKAKDYNKLSTPDEKTALKSDIQQYYGEFRDIPQLKDRIELKIKAVTEETKAILERVKRTAEWKTFRPYLKIAEDIETELKDIDLAKIEADIANPNSKSRQNYYSYLLSNRLFYSIQKIIQENMGTLKNAYTNFCCLMETRNNYMDFFIKMDQSIGKTLEIMAKLQPNVFYHPSQKLVLLYGKQIELQAPTLLDYINENKIFTKIDEIKRRIKYLLLTYVLLSEEGEHVGEKRLYNRYYDKYLSDINTHSRQDIRDKMKTSNPWMTEADLDYRVDNLYSKTDAGLIIQDMISDKYIWNLEDNVDAILNGKSREESLAIYNDLVKKLYLSSSFYVSKKSVERIPLDKFYDSPRQQLLEQYKTTTSVFNNLILAIKQDFREDKDILEASGDTYSMTLDQYMDRFYKPLVIGIEMYSELPVAIESVPDNELYTWINKFQEKCWKLLDERVVQDNKHLVELSSQNEWIKNLRALNNRKQIFEEIEKGLENQILIEGYTGDSILTQKTIRSKYFKARTQLKNLDTVKRYYEIVNENINRLKYFDMDCVYNILSRDVFKIHDKMAGELEWDLELKRYSIKSYLNNDRYRNINKNYILSSVPYENINSLMAFENRDILSGEFIQLASVSTTYLYYVIIYLIQTELLKLMVDREGDELNFICEYCSKFIWTDNLERIEMLNSMTEKAVKTHLRDLLSKENKDRLDKYTKMSESEKMAHKIYRELGLGNFFVGDVVADETEILSQIESDYQQGDNAAQAKEQASSEESINNQVRLLLGDDATEGSAQMTREYLEQQAAEDKDAAHEFRMVMGSNDVDDDAYNEEILD